MRAEIMKETLAKKMVRPSQRREMARWAVETRGASIRQACTDFAVSEACYRYQRKLADENAVIVDWLLRLCAVPPVAAQREALHLEP